MPDRSSIYAVEGRWPFPVDMLRRDGSEPATPEDALSILELSAPHLESAADLSARTVVLRLKDGMPRHGVAEARWASFRWRVLGSCEAAAAKLNSIEQNYRSALAKMTNQEIEALQWHGLDARH